MRMEKTSDSSHFGRFADQITLHSLHPSRFMLSSPGQYLPHVTHVVDKEPYQAKHCVHLRILYPLLQLCVVHKEAPELPLPSHSQLTPLWSRWHLLLFGFDGCLCVPIEIWYTQKCVVYVCSSIGGWLRDERFGDAGCCPKTGVVWCVIVLCCCVAGWEVHVSLVCVLCGPLGVIPYKYPWVRWWSTRNWRSNLVLDKNRSGTHFANKLWCMSRTLELPVRNFVVRYPTWHPSPLSVNAGSVASNKQPVGVKWASNSITPQSVSSFGKSPNH